MGLIAMKLPNSVDPIVAFLLELLCSRLPEKFTYHNLKHTTEVVGHVTAFAQADGLPESKIAFLRIAAAGHDTGFLIDEKANENIGVAITVHSICSILGGTYSEANEFLGDVFEPLPDALEQSGLSLEERRYKTDMLCRTFYKYKAKRDKKVLNSQSIDLIKDLVLSTALLFDNSEGIYRKPRSNLAFYLLDADLASFGSVNFKNKIICLSKEYNIHKNKIELYSFLKKTKGMLYKHVWLTAPADTAMCKEVQNNLVWINEILNNKDEFDKFFYLN